MSMRIKPCCSKLRINYNKQNEAIGEPASKKKNGIKSKKTKGTGEENYKSNCKRMKLQIICL